MSRFPKVLGLLAAILFPVSFGFAQLPDLTDLTAPATEAPPAEVADLTMETLEAGEGIEVEPGDFVTLHYVVRGEDGTTRFNSRSADRPSVFRVEAADRLRTWDRAVVGLAVGGKRKVTLPPNVEADNRFWLPPVDRTSVLTYEIELVSAEAGIRRTIEEPGEGREAARGDLVFATFEATFVAEDGSNILVSSGPQPVVFPLGTGRMLLGLQDGLLGVQAGQKLTLNIHPRLALGSSPILGLIAANTPATYRFEIQRVEQGISFTIEEEGTGPVARVNRSVQVHVTVLDAETEERIFSTFDDGSPRSVSFGGANEPVPSLFLAMAGMRQGEVRVARIPAAFAFGSAGYRDIIAPDTDLVYRIELVRAAN